ncbi:MAG: T9SS type A sorting domain-containing protein [Candidatus Cloacimonetes bacterium]|nr:T9SS type A sorting domain-containing protein [Candidatus Cloacimonadota bacterium]
MKNLFVVFLFMNTLLSAQNVWLNELHYDNVSTDEGEFVEIVLQEIPGNVLSDYTVTFYNGNNGLAYDSKTLDQFTVGISVDDFVILYYYKEGIQNGAPDGIAIDYQGTLIPDQFLSYEGTFEALDGSANGVTSTDIGVEEGSSTAIGESLQLLGTGAVYSDFVWQEPAPETPGELNNSQTFGGTPEPTIIVVSPNGGEQWEQGSIHPITWTSMNFTGNIKIELEMVNREREVLVASTEDDGSWEWNIPIDQIIDDWYAIIISDAEDGDPWDDSNAAFSIIEPIPVTPYTIYDIQYSSTGPSPHEGELVETSGVVTAKFENYFFIQDGIGAWNGITVYPLQEVEVGDEITISGTVLEYNDKTEITDIINMTILGTSDLPEPVIISSAELSSTEDYESVLAKIQNVTVSDDSLGYGEWEVEDQSGACIIGGLGVYTYIPILDDFIYSITGVVDYTYGAFKLEPRVDDDIDLSGVDVDDDLLTIKTDLLRNYPNPFNPSTTISFSLNNDNVENAELIIYNVKGQKIKTFPVILSGVEGQSSITWNGTNESGKSVTSGVYLYKLKTGDRTFTRKMLLLK